MYCRCWPAIVVVYVPLFRLNDFPHPDEILVDVGTLRLDEVVGVVVAGVDWGMQFPVRH